MKRIVTASLLSLFSLAAHAAVRDEAAAVAELPPPDATGLIGFLVVMVAMVGGYVWWIMRKERARKDNESAEK